MSSCCQSNYDLCIIQGATYQRVFTWIENPCAGGPVGSVPTPVDLIGYTSVMQMRPFVGSSTLLYDASGDITLGGTAGTISLTIPAVDTENFSFPTAVYDLFLSSGSGIVTRLLSGSVAVCPSVTIPSSDQFILLPSGQAILIPGGQGILTP